MPLPANVSTGTITGTFTNDDGSAASGRVVFTPDVDRLLDASANVVVVLRTHVAILNASGAFTQVLVATDDPDLNPLNWTWTVREEIDGKLKRHYSIAVPAGTTRDLADISPVPQSDGASIVVGPQGLPGTGALAATDAETIAGTLRTVWVNPASLAALGPVLSVVAGTGVTVAGTANDPSVAVNFATNAETLAGTLTTKAVTPPGLAAKLPHFDPRSFGAANNGTTDDRTALLAAIAAANAVVSGGGTVLITGSLGFTGEIDVPYGVNIVGTGCGKQTSEGTRLVCLNAAAQLKYGNQTTAGYYGVNGNFTLDANGLATNPLYLGVLSGMCWDPIYVVNAAAGGAAVKLAGSQNCTLPNLRIEDCAGDGLVFDLGAGGNTILSLGIADCAGWAVKFVQTGTSPLVYPEPIDNHIVGYIIESYNNNTSGLVYHGAGLNNSFTEGSMSHSGITSVRDLVRMRKDGTSTSSGLAFTNSTWFSNGSFGTVLDIGAGCAAFFFGRQSTNNAALLRVFHAYDGSFISNDAVWSSPLGSTWFVSPTATAGAEGTVITNVKRTPALVERPNAADTAFQARQIGGATFFIIDTNGAFNWTNQAFMYHYGTGGTVAIAGQVYATGAVTTKVKAGIPTDADLTDVFNGSIIVDSTNNRLYVRVGGVWKYAALI